MKSDHMMSVTEVSNHHSLLLEVFIVVEFENHLWNAIMPSNPDLLVKKHTSMICR